MLKLERLDDRIVPAAGQLDPFFGSGGMVTTPFGPGDDYAFSGAVDSNGRTIVAGYGWNGQNSDFALARYNPDGTLDTSFGAGGKVTTPIGSGNDQGRGVLIDGSGRIVVAGSTFNGSNMDLALARYHPDGSLDDSFDGDGKVTTPVRSGDDWLQGFVIQPDGKIVVTGASTNGSNYDFSLVRYTATGALDPSFGTGGIVTHPIGASTEEPRSIALQPDGKIVTAGAYFNGNKVLFVLVRYHPNGSFDNSFGTNGIATAAVGLTNAAANSIAIQPDGKIIAVGESWNGSNTDMAILRFDTSGALDPLFGAGGQVVSNFGSHEESYAVAVLPDGKFVVASEYWNGSSDDFAVARYKPDGTFDVGFDSDGRVVSAIGPGNDQPRGLVLQTDGKVVAVGFAFNGSDYDFALTQYLAEFHLSAGSTSVTFTEDDAPKLIDPALALTNSPNANLAGATVRIGNFLRSEDVLGYTPQTGINATFDPIAGVLTLTGSAGVAAYEAFLRSITYSNTSHRPTELSRSITVTVDDGEEQFNLASATYTVHVVARNDAPDLAANGELGPILAGNLNPPGQKASAVFKDLFRDPDPGDVLAGLALVANPADPSSEGRWQYSSDNGASWFDVSSVADDVTALAVSASTRLRFLPAAGFDGRPTPLTVRAIDSTFTGSFTAGAARQTVDASVNGGTTPIAATTANVETTIFPLGTGGNTPPTLAGVPVSANLDEGQEFAFTGTATDPDPGQQLTFSLLGAPAGASIDPDTGDFTWTPTEAQGPDTFVFKVRVTDGFTNTDETVTAVVREVNTAPTLAGVPPTATAVRGHPLTFTATATDPDLLNGQPNALTYSLVGGPPGAFIDPDTGVFTWAPEDTQRLRTYQFQVRVADDGVPAKSDTESIAVTVRPAALLEGSLVVGGTARADAITVRPSANGSRFLSILNGVTVGSFLRTDVTGRLIAHGLDGADRVTISAMVATAASLFGEDGNDTLTGGAGDDLLIGGSGRDLLAGGLGQDVSVGGEGVDRLTGGTGEDLLIAGWTTFDDAPTGFDAVLAEWTSNTPYADRVSVLTPVLTLVVQNDELRDRLTGGADTDWFVVSANDLFDRIDPEQALII
jgi:uncharacterized delta-60 repeat protein